MTGEEERREHRITLALAALYNVQTMWSLSTGWSKKQERLLEQARDLIRQAMLEDTKERES